MAFIGLVGIGQHFTSSAGSCCSRSSEFAPSITSPFRSVTTIHSNSQITTSTTTSMVFDFMKRNKPEEKDKAKDPKQAQPIPAPKKSIFGNVVDYVKERAAKDIQQVKAFNDGLTKSREKLARDLESVLTGSNADLDELFEKLEEVLIMSDLGVDTVEAILKDLRVDASKMRLDTDTDIKACLKKSLVRILESQGGNAAIRMREDGSPTILMVIGANGMGKTTTIGKLALRYKNNGKKVLLAACDTFRAAAVEQLDEWAKRASVDIVKPHQNQKSPASVIFDATKRAVNEEYDVLIIDTSGRLHTNANLMQELKKMGDVVKKARMESSPAELKLTAASAGADEVLLVVDASIGRNAVAQAETWQREMGVSGLAVTKLDGTARAGFVVSVVDELKIPVKLVGVGEKIEDLRDFDAVAFVQGLVG